MNLYGWNQAAVVTASITMLCAVWWIFEAIPIPATSLIPLALFPALGVLDSSQVAGAYGHPLILLLLGGFILSTSMEKSRVHHRLAIAMVNLFGANSSRRVLLGFMTAAAVLSMWISNTATTLMLLPVAIAVIDQAKDKRIAVPLLLGIAYAASVGGIGTPIGTPPNVLFMSIYKEATGQPISFVHWMAWGLPVVIIFIPVMGWWLGRHIPGRQQFDIPETGPWRTEEVRVMTVFLLTALAWITRDLPPFGGWSHLLHMPGANDASVALTAVVVMFLVPDGKGGRILDWQTANRIPWGILLLFGGGISIARAFDSSGISTALGQFLSGFMGLPVVMLLLIMCLSVTFLTEVTSNTATTALLMPILAAAGMAANIDPAVLMVPAAMSASCAFMLPVATAPNAIVYGSERVTIQEMVRAGLMLNLVGACVITLVCYIYFG